MSHNRAKIVIAAAVLCVAGLTGDRSPITLSAAGAFETSLVRQAAIGLHGWDAASDLAVDAGGAAYVTGRQVPNIPDFARAFVTKVGADGTVAYTAFIGSPSDNSEGVAIAVDQAGNAYVAGIGGWDLPFTAGDAVPIYASVAFVAKLDAAGQVVYLHAITASGTQITPRDIAVDGSGRVYVAAYVAEQQGPAAPPREDVEVYRIDEIGGSRSVVKVLGGAGVETPTSMKLDAAGRIYVAGSTYSADFPTTADGFDRTPGSPNTGDGFVTVLSPDGSIVYSTLLGGGGDDFVADLAVDAADNIYALSQSTSQDFPVTAGAYGASGSGGTRVTKFDSSRNLIYAARLAGDLPYRLAVDGDGRVFVSGLALDQALDPTPDAYSLQADPLSQFVQVLDPSAASLEWSSYITFPGATAHFDDVRPTIALGPSGGFFVAGSLYDQRFFNGDPDDEVLFDPYGNTAPEDFKRNSFVLEFGVSSPRDTIAPTVTCAAADDTWRGTNASVDCQASDAESGLASAADAAFSLTTDVPDGSESTAATGTRTVCDVAGNCATAAAVAGFRIDRRAPQVSITSPTTRTYLLNEPIQPALSCVDGGSGIASCTASAIDTRMAGRMTFTVRATDKVGLASERSVDYAVGYAVTALYDQTKSHRSGSTVPVKLRLDDAAGLNVSSASIALLAGEVVKISNQASSVVEDAGNANPDSGFRYADGGYVFNLKTTGLTTGTYELQFFAGADPTVHAVRFSVR